MDIIENLGEEKQKKVEAAQHARALSRVFKQYNSIVYRGTTRGNLLRLVQKSMLGIGRLGPGVQGAGLEGLWFGGRSLRDSERQRERQTDRDETRRERGRESEGVGDGEGERPNACSEES